MQDTLKIFEESGALLKGHFRLTSGLHSATYLQCAKVLQYPDFSLYLAQKIVHHFRDKSVEVVISPAIGGIVVGQEVGRQLGVRTIFTEREGGVMQLRRGFKIASNEKILICEDVVTTGGSVFEIIDLAKKSGGEIVGVGFIVDRSNGEVEFGVDQYSVMRLNIETYSEDLCPLCAEHVPLEKPGSRDTTNNN
jgi:orotate phosphoribosyltransferase